MASSPKTLPDTMVSPETGQVLRWDVRPSTVTYKGKSRRVDLPGHYPDNGNDCVHIGDDMELMDAALPALKQEVEGIPSPGIIRRVRQKLNLSQRELRLLDRHPELVEELLQPSAQTANKHKLA